MLIAMFSMLLLPLAYLPAVALAAHYHRQARARGASAADAWLTTLISWIITTIGYPVLLYTVANPLSLLALAERAGPESAALWTAVRLSTAYGTVIGLGLLPQWLIYRCRYQAGPTARPKP